MAKPAKSIAPCVHCGNVPPKLPGGPFCMECGALRDKLDADKEEVVPVSLGVVSEPPMFRLTQCLRCESLPGDCNCPDENWITWALLERSVEEVDLKNPYASPPNALLTCADCQFNWAYRCWSLRQYAIAFIDGQTPPKIDICTDFKSLD